MLYGSKKNKILSDAYRIESPTKELSAIKVIISESDLTNVSCAHIADRLFRDLYNKINNYNDKIKDPNDPDVYVILVDFYNVKNMGAAFLEKYIQYCLTSKYKIFNLNLSLLGEAAYSQILESIFNIQ